MICMTDVGHMWLTLHILTFFQNCKLRMQETKAKRHIALQVKYLLI